MNTQQKLPQGWVTSSLLELVLSITYGHTASATEEPIGPKFLRITDLQNGTVRWNTVPYCKCEDAAKYLLKKDDIVVARTGATTGKSYLIPSTPEKSVFASYLIRIETPEQYPVEFLALFMQSPSYWQQITVIKKGSAQPGANATALGKLRVPLAPANEQRRIADKINALQAKSKKAREGLKAARPLLDKLRQSVLASAFRGDLTADWRAKNPDVEPTSALLERIREERRRRWEEAELAKMRAKGKEPKNDKWKDRYKEPEPVDTTGLPELPEGWCWTTIAELESGDRFSSYGVLKPGPHISNGIRFIKSSQVRDGELDLSEDYRISNELDRKYKRTKLLGGEVLLNLVGASIGRSAVASTKIIGANVTRAIAVIPIQKPYPEWVQLCLQGPIGQSLIAKKAGGSAQPVLNLAEVRSLQIPLAPDEERFKIIRKIQKALLSIKKLSKIQEDLSNRFYSLDQSILAKAFRGELVPQDPNDEPASVLLERIRTERETLKPKRKTTRKRKKNGRLMAHKG